MEIKNKKKYILLKDLEVYQLARQLSKTSWEIYEKLDWQTKKIIGDQFITAIDSTGANIAEGYGRFHYLDKIRFFYNARASLIEAIDHWLELLYERKRINETHYQELKKNAQKLSIKLNNFIATTYRSKSIKNN